MTKENIEAGAKHDKGKPKVYSGVMRYFPRAIIEIARVSEHGASIHKWNTWDTIENPLERYSNASIRHELSQCMGVKFDAESKIIEQAHVAWNDLARLELMLRDIERSKNIEENFIIY